MTEDKLVQAAQAANDPGSPASTLFWAYMARQSIVELAMVALLLFWLVYFMRIRSRRPKLDPADFLTGDNGQFSLPKGCAAGAWVISSMVLLHIVATGGDPTTFGTAYLTAWVVNVGNAKWAEASVEKARAQATQPPGQVTNIGKVDSVQQVGA